MMPSTRGHVEAESRVKGFSPRALRQDFTIEALLSRLSGPRHRRGPEPVPQPFRLPMGRRPDVHRPAQPRGPRDILLPAPSHRPDHGPGQRRRGPAVQPSRGQRVHRQVPAQHGPGEEASVRHLRPTRPHWLSRLWKARRTMAVANSDASSLLGGWSFRKDNGPVRRHAPSGRWRTAYPSPGSVHYTRPEVDQAEAVITWHGDLIRSYAVQAASEKVTRLANETITMLREKREKVQKEDGRYSSTSAVSPP